MKRRDILKAITALPIAAAAAHGKTPGKMKITKPRRLERGDTVALVAPSSGVSEAEFNRALQNLENLGLKVKLGKYVREANGFLAGTDDRRAEDLNRAIYDKECAAIWCIRGGYGLTRILPKIDFAAIRKNPKPIIGYSDTTALLLAAHQDTGLVTFHGPGGSSTQSDYTRKHLTAALMEPAVPHKIELSPEYATRDNLLYKTQVITPGKAKGRLIGGNLSLITAMAGTPFALRDVKGKILFLEDVNERPYRIDRMFVQLSQSVDLRKAAGIALGIFDRCEPPNDNSQTVIDVVRDLLGGLGIPVIYGLSFGHIRDQFTLPLGVEAELDTAKATVTLLETAAA
jgi:muramoyltetrapeptide carboxypeptidase